MSGKKLTFDLFFNRFGGIQPLTDIVVVSVLQPEVVLLQDVHLIVDLLQQLLSGGLFLKLHIVSCLFIFVKYFRG